MTLHEIPKPIGQFILDNAEGVQGLDGLYYHYSTVCDLLKKYARICIEASLQKAAENAKTIAEDNGLIPIDRIDKQSITNPENIVLL